MVYKLKPPPKPAINPGFAATVPAPLDPYAPVDLPPLPDVIEKNSDSVWALWSDAMGETPEEEPRVQPETLLMGLRELPKDPDV